MANQSREPRWGSTGLYEVRVSSKVNFGETIYVRADNIVVPPSGALIMIVEVPAVEDLEQEEDERSGAIESPPALVIAPGLWYSAVQVTPAHEGHKPWFYEGGALDQAADEE